MSDLLPDEARALIEDAANPVYCRPPFLVGPLRLTPPYSRLAAAVCGEVSEQLKTDARADFSGQISGPMIWGRARSQVRGVVAS